MQKTATILFLMFFTVLILFTGLAQAQEFVTDGLVGFWSLDKKDIKGNIVNDIFGKNPGKIVRWPENHQGRKNFRGFRV